MSYVISVCVPARPLAYLTLLTNTLTTLVICLVYITNDLEVLITNLTLHIIVFDVVIKSESHIKAICGQIA